MNIDEDDTRLFRPLEPGKFGIYTELDELPVSGCPVYLMKGVGGICLSGTATVQVFGHRFRIVRGMVLALFPWQLISIKEVSDDFGIRFFRISHDMFTDTLSSLWRPRPGFFFRLGAARRVCRAVPEFLRLAGLSRRKCPRHLLPRVGDAAFAGVLLGHLRHLSQ